MKRAIVLAAGLLVGGCALPVPVQVASWIIDGVSLIATKKSVADHGISVVAQQDCALFRGLTDGEVCREWDGDESIMVAAASETDAEPETAATAGDLPLDALLAGEPVPAAPEPVAPEPEALEQAAIEESPAAQPDRAPSAEALAEFETAAGGDRPATDQLDAMLAATEATPEPAPEPATAAPAADTLVTESPAPETPASTTGNVAAPFAEAAPAIVAPAAKPAVATETHLAADEEPRPGLYFVIGSFHSYDNAQSLTGRYAKLKAEILAARLNSATVFRVVVGPFDRDQERTLRRALYKAGIKDSWAIKVRPGDWLSAKALERREVAAMDGRRDDDSLAQLAR